MMHKIGPSPISFLANNT